MSTIHPWLGPVTDQTRIGRLKYVLLTLQSGGTPDTGNSAFWTDDGIPWVAISDMSNTDFVSTTSKHLTAAGLADKRLKPLAPGTLLYSMYASLGHVTELSVPAVTNQAILGMSFSELAHPRFAFWQLKALQPYVVEFASSSTQDNLNAEKVRNLPFAIPPTLDQECIANFLDDKTARIDALIAEKERLLATLVEWRAAELKRVCFGEDDATVSTDNAWIPEIPKGWRVVRLKHLVSGIEQGWSPECEARLADEDEWGVLKAGAANAGVYREDEHKALPASLEPLPELEVHSGDVLITRASGTAEYVGSFAYVYATRPKLMLSDKNFRIKFGPEPQLLPELLAWMCNTRVLREQILQFVSGADGLAKNIGSGNLRELWLAVPPLHAQPRLVDELHASRTKLDGLSQHVVVHIARLREYRSSLISAAVTGQLDISTSKEAA